MTNRHKLISVIGATIFTAGFFALSLLNDSAQQTLQFLPKGVAGAAIVAAVMLVPYPPGIPIMMGGELADASAKPICDYLLAREEFENAFPGYEGDIHGVERERTADRTYFRTLVVKK